MANIFGVSVRQIGNIESGKTKKLPEDYKLKAAAALNIDPSIIREGVIIKYDTETGEINEDTSQLPSKDIHLEKRIEAMEQAIKNMKRKAD